MQPAAPANFQFRSSASLTETQAANLAGELSKLVDAMEIAQFSPEGSLYLFTRELGLTRLSIDQAGETYLRAGHIDALLAQAAGSMAEFRRLLRTAQGIPWLDQLEPLRQGRPKIERLLRAI